MNNKLVNMVLRVHRYLKGLGKLELENFILQKEGEEGGMEVGEEGDCIPIATLSPPE